MNIFRLLGDSVHLIALFILFVQFFKSKSCSGVSGKSQILFALVFATRYLDLFTHFISLYNTVMKVFYLASSFGTVYLIFFKFKATYDKAHDTFCIDSLLVPSAILAIFVNHDFNLPEICWAFSIYLESVAIVPQLCMIARTSEIKKLMKFYLILLASYRAFYILNWIYRYSYESHFDFISIAGGVVQVLVYLTFFLRFNSLMMKSSDQHKISPVSIISESNFLVSYEKFQVLNQLDTCHLVENEKQDSKMINEDIVFVTHEQT